MPLSTNTFKNVKPIPLQPLPRTPLISILIANYNYGKYIGEAIESVLSQTYQNFEIIICDDGSTDDSLAVIHKYSASNPRFRVICQPNMGHASALNTAFNVSRGDIIATLDADDMWVPDRLESVVNLFRERPECGLTVHPLTVIDSHNRVLRERYPRTSDEGWLAPRMLSGYSPVLPPSSGLSLHRKVAEVVFPLPQEFRSWADLVIAERAAFITPVCATAESKGYYRQHSSNTTGSAGPTTLPRIQNAISQIRRVVASHAGFVQKIHGITIDTQTWTEQRLGELILAERLYLYGTTPWTLIRKYAASPARACLWMLLFNLPQPLSLKLFQLWWGEWSHKRFFRRFIRLNRW